jgi:hypothetical protein
MVEALPQAGLTSHLGSCATCGPLRVGGNKDVRRGLSGRGWNSFSARPRSVGGDGDPADGAVTGRLQDLHRPGSAPLVDYVTVRADRATSTSHWRRPSCACSSWRECAPTAARSSSAGRRAPACPKGPGRICCVTPSGAGCARAPATGTVLVSGPRSARSSRPLASSAADPTRPARPVRPTRSAHRSRRRPDRDLGAKTPTTPAPPPRARSCPRRSGRSPTTLDQLLAFYDYPAERWVHLRTTNRLRRPSPRSATTGVTNGPGSQAAGLAMTFKLIETAQNGWCATNGPNLVGNGSTVINGHLAERPTREHHRGSRLNDHDLRY